MTTPTNITPKDAFEALKTGKAVLIDVREPDEFKAEHIAFAYSLPLSAMEKNFESFALSLSPETHIFMQCLRGARGQQACMRVSALDRLENPVFNIEGGLTAWKENGLPVIGAGGPKFTIFRQVQMIVGALVALMVMLGFAGITLAFMIAGILGAALFFAGVTGWCGLALLLARMPWNK